MVTVKLGRSIEDFWAMTPRLTGMLIREWTRMEELQGKAQATRTAYAMVMMQSGKMPFEEEADTIKESVNNDDGFMGL